MRQLPRQERTVVEVAAAKVMAVQAAAVAAVKPAAMVVPLEAVVTAVLMVAAARVPVGKVMADLAAPFKDCHP